MNKHAGRKTKQNRDVDAHKKLKKPKYGWRKKGEKAEKRRHRKGPEGVSCPSLPGPISKSGEKGCQN